jgi:hypothetical protein
MSLHLLMRRSALIVVGFVSLTMTACTTSEQNSAESITTTPETEVATTQPDERITACTIENFSIALGEQSTEPYCVEDWATALPQEYIENCGDCESVWLFHWTGTEWSLKGTCYQFAPLTEDGAPCSTPDGTELDEFPPASVACAIWPANSFEENVATTGCTT